MLELNNQILNKENFERIEAEKKQIEEEKSKLILENESIALRLKQEEEKLQARELAQIHEKNLNELLEEKQNMQYRLDSTKLEKVHSVFILDFSTK